MIMHTAGARRPSEYDIIIDTFSAPWLGAVFYRIGADSGGVSAPLWLAVPQLVPSNATVFWTSVTNRSYDLERSSILSEPMLFTPVATNLPGQTGATSYVDTSAGAPGSFFYRVRVQQ